jgi:hypothetical protein
MQPHSIRVKLRDQPLDAFDLLWISRRTQQLAVALNPFVYFYARLAHALMASVCLLCRGHLVFLRFEFGGPSLEVFRHIHKMKISRIIPREFFCQPQARFGPFSEIPCIHDALLASIRMSKDIKP